VGRGAQLRGAVVGRSSDLREHVRLDEGVVVGDECFIGRQAVISAGVIYGMSLLAAGRTWLKPKSLRKKR